MICIKPRSGFADGTRIAAALLHGDCPQQDRVDIPLLAGCLEDRIGMLREGLRIYPAMAKALRSCGRGAT